MLHRSLASRARRLLDGVIPDDLLDPYLPLLVEGGCRLEDAPGLLGSDGQAKLLVHHGMAYLQRDHDEKNTRLVPASPDLTLQRALARLAGELAAEHQRLLDGQERLRAAQAAADPSASGSMDQLVQVLTDPGRITELTATLAGSARIECLILGDRLFSDQALQPPTYSAGSVKCRAIYESSRAETPAGRESIKAVVRAGAAVRLLPKTGMCMRIADEAIALIPLAERALEGALLLQSSVIVGALREYFELLWERAAPYDAPDREDERLPPIQMKVLRLLVQGLPDKAIADQAGMSLTTVGRHINAIREVLGVQNRFAIGAEAVRREFVD